MSELKALIASAIIILGGSLIIECNSFYLLINNEIDVMIFITNQIAVLCLLALLYLEYRDYDT